MPAYEYRCSKCGEEFIRYLSLREYETAKVTCPKCGAAEVVQQMSVFTAQTSRKS